MVPVDPPFAWITAGHEKMQGDEIPPSCVKCLYKRNGVSLTFAHGTP